MKFKKNSISDDTKIGYLEEIREKMDDLGDYIPRIDELQTKLLDFVDLVTDIFDVTGFKLPKAFIDAAPDGLKNLSDMKKNYSIMFNAMSMYIFDMKEKLSSSKADD